MLRLGLGCVVVLLLACGDSGETTSGTTSATGGGGAATGGSGGSGGSGGNGGTGASGGTGGGGGSPCDVGQPVTAPDDTWTYVEVAGAVCGTAGTTAGFFINPTAQSERLVIFFQGGGACFNQGDCQASSLNGFDETQQQTQLAQNPFFNRQNANNPFADFDYVFVPYCNGDFHSGSNTASFGMQHQGYANVTLYMERVLPTFCAANYVLVTGTSAGGFGAAFNYDRIHRLFGAIPVDLVDDSGPYLRPPYMPSDAQDGFDLNWGFGANMPADCAACTTTWHDLYTHAASAWPDDRQSLISSVRDPSIQGRFAPYSTSLASLDDFEIGINDLADQVLVPLASFRVFYVAAPGHVYLNSPLTQTITDGVTLATFLQQQIDDDPAWVSVRP